MKKIISAALALTLLAGTGSAFAQGMTNRDAPRHPCAAHLWAARPWAAWRCTAPPIDGIRATRSAMTIGAAARKSIIASII